MWGLRHLLLKIEGLLCTCTKEGTGVPSLNTGGLANSRWTQQEVGGKSRAKFRKQLLSTFSSPCFGVENAYNYGHKGWAPAQESHCHIVTFIYREKVYRRELNTGGLAFTRWAKQGVRGKRLWLRKMRQVAHHLLSPFSSPFLGWNSLLRPRRRSPITYGLAAGNFVRVRSY